MAEQLIPDKLWKIAKDLGLNSISFVKTDKDFGDIFSLGLIDDTGEYLPIGQPILYSVKGSLIEEIFPDAVHDILSTLKD